MYITRKTEASSMRLELIQMENSPFRLFTHRFVHSFQGNIPFGATTSLPPPFPAPRVTNF